MRTKVILFSLLFVFLLACNSVNKKEVNNGNGNTNEESANTVVDSSVVELNNKEVSEFQQLLDLASKSDVMIPSSYYNLLGTKPEREYEEFKTLIPISKLNKTDYVLFISEPFGCTPIICQIKVHLVLFRNGTTLVNYEFPFDYELVDFSFSHDLFFLAQATNYTYESDENDVMSRTEATPTIIREYTVILNDKISALQDLSKEDLRLCRNLIFARYGYRFKDENLNSYFSAYDWYRPSYDNVDDRLTDNDKQLIKTIRELEIQKQ